MQPWERVAEFLEVGAIRDDHPGHRGEREQSELSIVHEIIVEVELGEVSDVGLDLPRIGALDCKDIQEGGLDDELADVSVDESDHLYHLHLREEVVQFGQVLESEVEHGLPLHHNLFQHTTVTDEDTFQDSIIDEMETLQTLQPYNIDGLTEQIID